MFMLRVSLSGGLCILALAACISLNSAQAETQEKPAEFSLPAPPDIGADIEATLASMSARPVAPAVLPEPSAPIDASFALVPTQILPPQDVPSAQFPADIRFFLDLDEAKLRAFIEPLRAKFKIRPDIANEFATFYRQREFAPVWPGLDDAVIARFEALKATLAGAHQDGLDANRLLSALPDGFAKLPREERDLGLSFAAYLYAHDARGGRLDPVKLSSLLTPKLHLPQAEHLLSELSIAKPSDLASLLGAFQPGHRDYRALRSKLAALRNEESVAHTSSVPVATIKPVLPPDFMGNATIAPGAVDARIPLMRVRLGMPPNDDSSYSPEVVEAVKAFQRANNLTPNGRLTPRTRALLEDGNSPTSGAERKPERLGTITQIIANMERWRWLPPELGQTHIFVNIPQFRLKMKADNATVFETKVIVGKPETQTPVFSDAMDFLVVNPSWYVPPSILKKEFLPRLAADPDYARKRGYEVVRSGKHVGVRQPPGEKNALGHVKFMFPNLHSVYLHDTPGRHLFGREARALSHGCVRVEGPFRLAEQLLLAKQGFSEAQLRSMVGRGERTIKLNEKVPVHLAYFTVQVDDAGNIINFHDLYGHDQRIRRALAL